MGGTVRAEPSSTTRGSGWPVVLLFGMPRSGTTWIGKIFDSHPATLYRHEPDSYLPLRDLPLLISGRGDSYCGEITGYVERLRECRMPVVTTKLPLFPKHYLSRGGYLMYRASVYLSIAVRRITPGLGSPTFNPLGRGGEHGPCLVWKSVESLGRLAAIRSCLGNCRAIHIVRHPCGFVSSILRGESQERFFSHVRASEGYRVFAKLLATETGRSYGLTMERLKGMEPVERLAWRWVLFNEHALRESSDDPACMVLRYEDLCRDPVGVSRRMLRFAGLEWHSQTARFLRSSTAAGDDSYYGVIRDPLQAAFRWRESLSAAQIEAIQRIVGESRIAALYDDIYGLRPS